MEYLEKTTDYNKFSLIEGNRKINKNHLQALKKSITDKNLLHLNPILIDRDFLVLDGQHRLEACKNLDIPVFYRIIEDTELRAVWQLNTNRKNWKTEDYLNFYIECIKDKNYIALKEFIDKHSLTLIKTFIFLGFKYRAKKYKDTFMQGDFCFDFDIENVEDRIYKYKNFIEFCDSRDLDGFSSFLLDTFILAFLDFIGSKKIQWNKFYKQIKEHPTLLVRCYNRFQFLEMLLKLYNKNSSYKIEISDL